MSIKGIDSQMMITRAVEFVNDASAQLKAGEKMQQALAHQGQVNTEHKQISVVTTEKSQEAQLHLENEAGGGSGGYESAQKQESEQEYEQPGVRLAKEMLEADVGPSTSIIDIKL